MDLERFDLSDLVVIEKNLNAPNLYLDEPLFQVYRDDDKDSDYYSFITVLYRKSLDDNFEVAYSYESSDLESCFSLTKQFKDDFNYDKYLYCGDLIDSIIDEEIDITSNEDLL